MAIMEGQLTWTCEFEGCGRQYANAHSRRQHYRRSHKQDWDQKVMASGRRYNYSARPQPTPDQAAQSPFNTQSSPYHQGADYPPGSQQQQQQQPQHPGFHAQQQPRAPYGHPSRPDYPGGRPFGFGHGPPPPPHAGPAPPPTELQTSNSRTFSILQQACSREWGALSESEGGPQHQHQQQAHPPAPAPTGTPYDMLAAPPPSGVPGQQQQHPQPPPHQSPYAPPPPTSQGPSWLNAYGQGYPAPAPYGGGGSGLPPKAPHMHQPQQEGYGAPAGGDAYASSTHPFALLQQTVNKEWVEANARRQSSMTAEQMGGEYMPAEAAVLAMSGGPYPFAAAGGQHSNGTPGHRPTYPPPQLPAGGGNMPARGAYEQQHSLPTGAPQQPGAPQMGSGVPFSVAQHISTVEAEYRRQQQQGSGNAGPAGDHAAYYQQAAYAQQQQQQQQQPPQQQQMPARPQHTQAPSGIGSAPHAPPTAGPGQGASVAAGAAKPLSLAGSSEASAQSSAGSAQASDAEDSDAEPAGSMADDATNTPEVNDQPGVRDQDAAAVAEGDGDHPTVNAAGEDIAAA